MILVTNIESIHQCAPPPKKHYPLHLIIVPIMELALMLTIAAYITAIDMNLLYLLSIPLGTSIAHFLSPRTIEDYYDHDYTKYEQSIALTASNLLCLMVVTYYNVPVFAQHVRDKQRSKSRRTLYMLLT